MTGSEVYYNEKIKTLQDILHHAEVDYKVMSRTVFLEIEDPIKRAQLYTKKLTVQKNKLINDLLILCEKISKIEFEK